MMERDREGAPYEQHVKAERDGFLEEGENKLRPMR